MENPFKWWHYGSEIILLCVRWYLRFALSYRDFEEMMTERGLLVVHTTIYRWVQAYAPESDCFMNGETGWQVTREPMKARD